MQIIKAPNPVLRAETKLVKKITPNLVQTIKEMAKLTGAFKDPEGVGLAGPQVGVSEQFFIAKFEKRNDPISINGFSVIINPRITGVAKVEKKFLEGCLSIPDYYSEIARPSWIKIAYMDIEGRQQEEKFAGVNAFIFQHEFDHLHGRLFIDLVMQQKARLYKIVGKDQTGADIFEEVEL